MIFIPAKGQIIGIKNRNSSYSRTRNTRNKDMMNAPVYKSAAGERTFRNRAILLWNSLPRTLKDYSNITVFKRDHKAFVKLNLKWLNF